MVLWILRGLFVLLMIAASLAIGRDPARTDPASQYSYLFMLAAIIVAVVLVGLDVFLTRKSLAAISGAFLGLVAGMVFAYGLGLIVDLRVVVFFRELTDDPHTLALVSAIKLLLGVVSC
jgi:hypothetical protein